MSTIPFPIRAERRYVGIAITLALHLALVWIWRANMQTKPVPDSPPQAMQWVNVKLPPPPPPKARPEPKLASAAPAKRRAAPERAPAAPAVPPVQLIIPPTPQMERPVAAPPAAPATPSAADMLAQAKRDIGKFDKDLRKEFAGKGISKPVDSPQLRLAQGMEDAYDAAPPKWYESAKIKIIDPGQYGRKRYRVTTAFGTYCMTYESNNSPTAQLDPSKRVEPKMTNCPPNEQPATTQKW
ncbi:MAG TPA: hypothetical protein VGC21_23165 [Telluria sp.]|jgi:hypothetical protein